MNVIKSNSVLKYLNNYSIPSIQCINSYLRPSENYIFGCEQHIYQKQMHAKIFAIF